MAAPSLLSWPVLISSASLCPSLPLPFQGLALLNYFRFQKGPRSLWFPSLLPLSRLSVPILPPALAE